MHAITVHQPYAQCIAIGAKPVENRGRRISEQYLGQALAIHAGRLVDGDALRRPQVIDALGADVDDLPTGAVVAVATLTDCHPSSRHPYPVCCPPWGHSLHYGLVARPAWHLVLADVRRLGRPVPVRGQQAVPWRLPPEVAEQVSAQLHHQHNPKE